MAGVSLGSASEAHRMPDNPYAFCQGSQIYDRSALTCCAMLAWGHPGPFVVHQLCVQSEAAVIL